MAATLTAPFSGDDVALSTSAALIFTATATASVNEPEVIIVQNNSAIVVTVGGSDVTDGVNGITLPASGNNSVTIPLRFPGILVYAIAASGTPVVSVVRA